MRASFHFRLPSLAALLLASTTLGASLSAQGVVDQYQLDGPNAAPLFLQTDGSTSLVQTFVGGMNGTLAGIELRLRVLNTEPEPMPDWTIEILSVPYGLSMATVLGAVTLTESQVGPYAELSLDSVNATYVDLEVLSIPVTVGDKLAFRLTAPHLGRTTDPVHRIYSLAIRRPDLSDEYADGDLFRGTNHLGDAAFKVFLKNAPPTADAGADQSLTQPTGQSIALAGSGTDDYTPSASLLYAWTLVAVPSGSGATLTAGDTATPTFVPDLDGDYTAELVVTDAQGLASAPDQVLVTVTVDDPPVANAGPDQLAVISTTVQLDGSLSTDDLTAPTSLLYAWTISSAPAGSMATLADAGSALPTLVPDVAGDYTIDLIVTDASNQVSPTDQVVVTAAEPNAAPTADAGADATTATNVAIQLDGSNSSDPDLDPLTVQWSLASAPTGSAAMLVGDTSATPTFSPDLPGTYVVALVVNDGFADSATDSMEIEAIDASDYARSKIHEVDCYVAGLPLSSFYDGASSNSRHQTRRARIAKRWMRCALRVAAWQAYWLDRTVSCQGSAQQIEARRRSTLHALSRVVLRTDGVALRSVADVRNSGFRLDLITDPVAAQTVHDCLLLAIGAVEAAN